MQEFSFQSQELKVDWVTFNFKDLYLVDLEKSNSTLLPIAKQLSKLGFNCFQKPNRKAEQPILIHSKNESKVSFIESYEWPGVNLVFTGVNSEIFYNIIKTKTINWQLFSSARLTRFDLCYSQEIQKSDQTSVNDFLMECAKKTTKNNRNTNLITNKKGKIFTFGNRKSKNFYRIYEKDNALRFEQEIKYLDYSLLALKDFEQFENQLSNTFIENWSAILPLYFSYTDWLVCQLRTMRDLKINTDFKTDYIQNKVVFKNLERTNFLNLLYFLNYSQSLDYEIDSLGSTYYRKVTLQVKHFLSYKNESYNYYQLKKILQFFDELQKNSLIKFFSDKKYRSLVSITEVIVEKRQLNSWFAEVWIAEELFDYAHPFLLPDLFRVKLTKHQFEVQFKFIQTFSSMNVEKIFHIQEFFNTFSSSLNGRQKLKIKEYFVQLVQLFKEYNLIEGRYKIIHQGKVEKVKNLNSRNITEGFIIYEKF